MQTARRGEEMFPVVVGVIIGVMERAGYGSIGGRCMIEDIISVKLVKEDSGSNGVVVLEWKAGWTEPMSLSLWTDAEKCNRVFDTIRKAILTELK